MQITLYHNPHCSKSRATLTLLEDRGLEFEIIEYLKNPPDQEILASLLQKLAISATQLVRRSELEYQTLKLAEASDVELIEAITKHPILMQRPIVVADNHAVIGRPPENVLTILEK